MAERLTKRQFQVLEFVRETRSGEGYSPTVREIADHFGFASHTSAEKHLVALEKKGFIRRRPGLARAIELIGYEARDDAADGRAGIPVIGRVTAGEPILATENIEGMLSFEDVFGEVSELFALRVSGDSMVNVGIDDGDLVVVRLRDRIASGQIGLAYVGEDCEATIKRIIHTDDGVRLQPENDAYEPTFISSDDPYLRIRGMVVGVVKRF